MLFVLELPDPVFFVVADQPFEEYAESAFQTLYFFAYDLLLLIVDPQQKQLQDMFGHEPFDAYNLAAFLYNPEDNIFDASAHMVAMRLQCVDQEEKGEYFGLLVVIVFSVEAAGHQIDHQLSRGCLH